MNAPESHGTLDKSFAALPKPDTPLPALFDATCDNCKRPDKPMERMDAVVCGRYRPLAIFQCQSCNVRLFIIEVDGEKAPLFIWSNEFRGSGDGFGSNCLNFSKYVEERIRAHKDKRIRRDVRERGVSLPSDMAPVIE